MVINSIVPETVLQAIHNTTEISGIFEAITPISQEWSASGALHFEAVHRSTQTPALIKVGLSQNELFWTEAITRRAPHLVPVLYGSGQTLAGVDLAWKAVEFAQGGVLGPQWGGREFDMLLEAGVEFQIAARSILPPPGQEQLKTRTKADVQRWLEEAQASQPPGPVQVLSDRLEAHFTWVEAHCETVTCHGDLHMCNGITRTGPPEADVLLVDYAACRQPWAFEAARLQVLNATDPNRPGFRDLVPKMGAIRQRRGLSTCLDLDKLARLTLAWYAIQMWHLIPERRILPGYAVMIKETIQGGAVV